MKIVLYSRPQMEHSPQELAALMTALEESDLEFLVNREFAEVLAVTANIGLPLCKQYSFFDERCREASVVMSYGGDGTFLDCVKLVDRHPIPILGVNSGRLGFLSNVPKECIRQTLSDLKSGCYTTQSRVLLEASGDFVETPEYPFAFNEFSIQRSGTSMISVETYVDGEMVATYWGDGVLLSTPAGSTAYALSVGGPVVAPECACLVLAPIASHNLTMRPVVIPDDSEVTFRLGTRDGDAFVTLDNKSCRAGDGATFTISKAKNAVFLVHLQNISFYDTLRNKMMWGFDRRDKIR